jgi:hypothetical protein
MVSSEYTCLGFVYFGSRIVNRQFIPGLLP